MGLEAATYTDDLIVTNPPGTDLKAQGDDHIRLLKTVLKNTFKRASRPFSFPGIVSKSADYAVLASDDGLTFVVNTSAGPVTLTLPALVSADFGWRIEVIKTTTDANPIFITSASNINGLTKIRRAIENTVTRVIWSNGGFIATRPHGAPIGSTHEHYGASLPNGYLWADGAAFNATNYPELNAVYGVATVPDCRGRSQIGRDNMGVGAAGRVDTAGSAVDGATVRGTGGAQFTSISIAQMPVHTPTGGIVFNSSGNDLYTPVGSVTTTITINGAATGISASTPSNYLVDGGTNLSGSGGQGVHFSNSASNSVTITDPGHPHTGSASSSFVGTTVSAAFAGNNIGSGNPHNNMQPSIVCNVIVLAE